MEIAADIVSVKGYPEEAMTALIRRVRAEPVLPAAARAGDKDRQSVHGAMGSGCGEVNNGDICRQLQTTIQPSTFSFLCPLLGFLPARKAVTSSRISSVLFLKFSLQ